MPGRFARKIVEEYLTAIVESDVTRVDKSLRDPERVRRILKSLARLQGTQSLASVICADLREYEGTSLSDDAVYKYLAALRKTYVTDDMSAWRPALLIKTSIRTSDTRYFTDSSVAATVLGINPGDLMNDLPTCGIIFFETMVVRDLRIYADALGRASRIITTKTILNAMPSFISTTGKPVSSRLNSAARR